MKVAAYCRVSTDREDQINSLESQKRYFEDFINRNSGWTLADIYADEGTSGTQAKKRPAFMRMMEDADKKKFELILTKEISRFARNTLDSLQYTRRLKSLGVGVVFINDNINTLDPDAELRLTIMSSIAQEEVRKISERVKWGQKRRMEQGVVFGNGIFGYELKKGQLTVKENEAEIVRLIYHKFVNEGKGSQTIARELYEAGYESKYKSEWSTRNILNIIKNEKYAGDLLQKKFFTPNYLDHKKIINKNNEDTVYIKDHHEPLVDRGLWERAQEDLAKRSPSREEKPKYSNRYWCSGKVKCGICGARYIQKTNKRKYGLYRVWVCHNSSKHGPEKTGPQGKRIGCGNITVNYKTLAACMGFAVNLVLKNQDILLSEIKDGLSSVMRGRNTADVGGLERKIKSAVLKKDKLVELYVNSVITMDELKEAKIKYENEISGYEKQIRDAKNLRPVFDKGQDEFVYGLDNIFKDIAGKGLADEEIAEEVFRQFLERITVYKDSVTVTLKNIPGIIHLYYKTRGVKDRYETDIVNYDIHY